MSIEQGTPGEPNIERVIDPEFEHQMFESVGLAVAGYPETGYVNFSPLDIIIVEEGLETLEEDNPTTFELTPAERAVVRKNVLFHVYHLGSTREEYDQFDQEAFELPILAEFEVPTDEEDPASERITVAVYNTPESAMEGMDMRIDIYIV